jgi:acyl-CoA synthetase (AMP-forming)/AMP-acid ligase II
VVPTAPPRRQLLRGRLELIAQDARAEVVLCDFDELSQLDVSLDNRVLPSIDLRAYLSRLDSPERAASFEATHVASDDIAFLQYTSGSTGDPKGVAVSHANLMHNSETIRRSMGVSEASEILIALPLFHDMGLVGGVLQSMYAGCTTSFMPPAELVQYPERWLQRISMLRVTTSGGPNFIYELAADELTPEQVEGLDLSSWQVAFCGAEPIRAATVAKFTQRFAGAGFRPESFYPCYGMAEATLFITGGGVCALPPVVRRNGSEVVGCGSSRLGTTVRIVDPDTRRALADGEIGEIWVNGEGVAKGYWGREALTEQSFRACIEGEDDRCYLRTGDLGWWQDEHLYVSGRLKDIVILNGKKYAPQDIEDICEQTHPALRRAGSAAFGALVDGTEKLVVVAELEREWLRRTAEHPAIAAAVRIAVNAAHGVDIADVVWIKPGALPRTSSGKVRRSQCRIDYQAGVFEGAPTPALA